MSCHPLRIYRLTRESVVPLLTVRFTVLFDVKLNYISAKTENETLLNSKMRGKNNMSNKNIINNHLVFDKKILNICTKVNEKLLNTNNSSVTIEKLDMLLKPFNNKLKNKSCGKENKFFKKLVVVATIIVFVCVCTPTHVNRKSSKDR